MNYRAHGEEMARTIGVDYDKDPPFVFAKSPEGRTADLTFVDNSPLEGFSYYYVRVIQKDKEMAWSSPVWLGEKK